MKFPYSLSKQFVFPILAMQFLIHGVSSLNLTNDYLNHKCFLNQGIYNSRSEYKDNLNILLRVVRTGNYTKDGFMGVDKGEAPDSVSVMFQCRGDTYGSKCNTCADTAVAGFRKRCSMNKGGIIWYDQCFLWVSAINEDLLIRTNYKNIFPMYNPNNVRGDAKLFAKRVVYFLSELTLKIHLNTKKGSVIILYSSGEKKFGKNTLYAMVQCVGSTLDCRSCLAWSINKLFKNGDIKQGGRVLGLNYLEHAVRFGYKLRERTNVTGKPILIHKKGSKVVGLDCNRVHPELLLSCGNDHFARIWDMRKLQPGDSLHDLAHKLVVNSAYFSPSSGTMILTTSQDNRIRV
ncbi:unnamed protein product [Eruca vesicaria subsp. sativa]|uniref:Gnk2-homologous domain-containing protein n=1 Tax=Eruca vesicaria subsp. sativa TaxID=29727 RepID=A0ABC8KIB8_ERUVS|nr:unnamed protein product [Eruca vesicaria subsp. sativa]